MNNRIDPPVDESHLRDLRAHILNAFDRVTQSMGGLTENQIASLANSKNLEKILGAAIADGHKTIKLMTARDRDPKGYLPRAQSLMPPLEQIQFWQQLFDLDPAPATDLASRLTQQELPYGAEGWLVIPSTRGMQRLCAPEDELFLRHKLEHAFEKKIWEIIGKRRPVDSRHISFWESGSPINTVSEETMKMHVERTWCVFDDMLHLSQPGDLWIIGAQFGANQHKTPSANEFDLPAYALLCAILMHPMFLVSHKDHPISGAAYSLYMRKNGLLYGIHSGGANASGFLP